MIRSH